MIRSEVDRVDSPHKTEVELSLALQIEPLCGKKDEAAEVLSRGASRERGVERQLLQTQNHSSPSIFLHCRSLIRIPVNLIGRLKKLEELLIGDDSFKGWGDVGCDSKGGTNASLKELNSLSHLAVL
ncbi:hypothetical protein OIU85_025444 [Salix viminalis]|uniref:Uncharacterized protein n=1 Tax=Salix viminalis TaxID=40686 RepID=A0A9Q0YXM1_SALVM|nr:hypothetical protein OIU85_025444 [Salix viminalis]